MLHFQALRETTIIRKRREHAFRNMPRLSTRASASRSIFATCREGAV
jgi:hypothetical protein